MEVTEEQKVVFNKIFTKDEINILEHMLFGYSCIDTEENYGNPIRDIIIFCGANESEEKVLEDLLERKKAEDIKDENEIKAILKKIQALK